MEATEPGSQKRSENRVGERPRQRIDEVRRTPGDGLAVMALVLLVVLALTAPLLTYGISGNPGSFKVVRYIGYPASMVLAFASLGRGAFKAVPLLLPLPLSLLLLWCWLSLLWSADPGATFTRLVLLTTVTFAIFASVRSLGTRRVLALLTWMLAALVVLNILVSLILPSIGQLSFEQNRQTVFGAWHGVMAEKNAAGFSTVLAIVLLTAAPGLMPRAARIVFGLAAVFFLLKTDSLTPVVGGPAALLLTTALLLVTPRRPDKTAMPRPSFSLISTGITAIFVIAGCTVLALYAREIARALMVADALTHRTQIWSALVSFYGQHPLIGAGYGGFWDTQGSKLIMSYGQGRLLRVNHGHNAYLDILVSVGPVGLFLTLVAFVAWPLQMLRTRLWTTGGVCAYFLLNYVLVCSFSETQLLDRDAVGNVTALLSLAIIVHGRSEPERRRRSSRNAGVPTAVVTGGK